MSAVPIVEIYTKAYCGYCWRAKDLLAAKQVEMTEISVDHGGKDRQIMIERSGGRTTVPQIFIRGEHVGGCNELVRLDADGTLDALLAG